MKNSRKMSQIKVQIPTSSTRRKFQPTKSTVVWASDLRWAELLTDIKQARESVQKCIDEGIIEPRDLSQMSDDQVFKCIKLLKQYVKENQ